MGSIGRLKTEEKVEMADHSSQDLYYSPSYDQMPSSTYPLISIFAKT